jgi:hypothetical protein
MTSQEIKAAMERHDIDSVPELKEVLMANGFYYSSLLLDEVHWIGAMPEYVLISLKTLFEKLDREKTEWSKDKIEDLESENEYL